MHVHILETVLCLAAACSLVSGAALATRPKANEYKDGGCKDWNYGHNRFGLSDVTMDDSSHSVYLTAGQESDGTHCDVWIAFDGKTGNGGSCTGNKLGNMWDGCVNLDSFFNTRIRCVRDVCP